MDNHESTKVFCKCFTMAFMGSCMRTASVFECKRVRIITISSSATTQFYLVRRIILDQGIG
jgi:hypothetical protein